MFLDLMSVSLIRKMYVLFSFSNTQNVCIVSIKISFGNKVYPELVLCLGQLFLN